MICLCQNRVDFSNIRQKLWNSIRYNNRNIDMNATTNKNDSKKCYNVPIGVTLLLYIGQILVNL